MVYSDVLYYFYAAAIIFITVFVTAPIVYTVWFDSLRDTIPSTSYGNMLKAAGDLFFQSYQILGYLVVGIIIAWGFSVAARKGTQENIYPSDDF